MVNCALTDAVLLSQLLLGKIGVRKDELYVLFRQFITEIFGSPVTTRF